MLILLMLSLGGLIDSAYLTWEHYSQVIPPCSVNPLIPSFLVDCGKVLTSQYSTILGIPLALLGVIHYSFLSVFLLVAILTKNKIFRYLTVLQSIAGLFASVIFMYIQIGIIKSICLYCTLSAIISFVIFFSAYRILKKERFELHLFLYSLIYQKLLKPIFFLIDPETIHDLMISFGRSISKTCFVKLLGSKLIYQDKTIEQKLTGINFNNPVGLAAGFDYNGDLVKAMYFLGFGFQTIGTVTNLPYEGNPKPRLGRLPKSKSLMVNKGFKNIGKDAMVRNLIKDGDFKIPTGVSIGVSNSKTIKTVDVAIKDINKTFQTFENSKTETDYYELNISCPNLINNGLDFYKPINLNRLLRTLSRLKIRKPIFVKMPIEKTDRETVAMMKTLYKYKMIRGVIFGNLQKDRKDPSLDREEVKKFKLGNFSGKTCEKRSNELIKLAYRKFGERWIIIGSGGIFSAEDAYKKIRLGASLVQLITGMIYQGPQLVSQINIGLIDLLKKGGFKNISEAVGVDSQ